MGSTDDKKRLIVLARKGQLEGEDGFKHKLSELEKAEMTGPGDCGLDWCDKPYYRTALWEATWKNHDVIVKMLADKGATIDQADSEGRTPLHEAAFYGHIDLVDYLLEKGHPIDPKDNNGSTPLFRAVEGGRDTVIKKLLEKNAQINELDSKSLTVQHMAAFQGMPDMSEFLLFQGAWKNRFGVEGQGEQAVDKPTTSEAPAKDLAEAEQA